MKADTAALFGAQPLRADAPGGDARRFAYQPTDIFHRRQRQQLARIGGGDFLQRDKVEQIPGHRQHNRMQPGFRIFYQQQRARFGGEPCRAARLRQQNEHAQQHDLLTARIGFADQLIKAIERAPAVRAVAVLRLAAPRAFPGRLQHQKIVLHQLLHGGNALPQRFIAELMGLRRQLARQAVNICRQRAHLSASRLPVAAVVPRASAKARIAQAQHRMPPRQLACRLFAARRRQRLAVSAQKAARGGDLGFA